MYILVTQQPTWWGAVELVARTSLPSEAVAPAVRRAIRGVDPNLPASDFQTLSDIVERSVSPRRFTLLLVQAFAFIAIVLASLGIYGVLSYTVSQQTREIGIRMALGADAAHMQRRVLGRTLMMAAVGIGIGIVGAFALANVVASMLYGVEPHDPTTFAGVAVLLVIVATLAGYFPARRASRVEPMKALG
jgi:ABC-type antimicrobial peptide transport system permease subunit